MVNGLVSTAPQPGAEKQLETPYQTNLIPLFLPEASVMV